MQSISRSLRLPQGPSKGRYRDLSIKKFTSSFKPAYKINLCYNYIYLLARTVSPYLQSGIWLNAILDISL